MGKHEKSGKLLTAKQQKKENNNTDHQGKNEQQQTSNIQKILDEQVLFDPAVRHVSKQNIQQLPLFVPTGEVFTYCQTIQQTEFNKQTNIEQEETENISNATNELLNITHQQCNKEMDKMMIINCEFTAEVELLNLIIKHKISLSAFQPLIEWAKNSKFQPNYPIQKRETVLDNMYKHLGLLCLASETRDLASITFSSVSCSNFMYCLQVSTSLGISSWRCFSNTSMFDQALDTLCLSRTRWL